MNEYYKQLDSINKEKDLYFPSQVHGIDHTSRVMLFANVIVNLDRLDDRMKNLILTAARYHDIGRIDDRETKEHGLYGMTKLHDLNLLKGFSKKDQRIIEFAIEQHSLSKEENEEALSKIPKRNRKDYAMVLSYLKDIDALDRFRIANKNMQLDPNRLRNNTSRQLVDFAQITFNNYINIKYEYDNYSKSKEQSPEIRMIYDYVKDYYVDINWTIKNKDFLLNLYNKGVLGALKKYNLNLDELLDDRELLYAVSQIKNGDFEYLRAQGYNITYKNFLSIVSMYKIDTLDKLRQTGELNTLFTKETYLKYGREKSFEERLKTKEIDDKSLFNLINSSAAVKLSIESFEKDYLLFKNLYNRNPDAFNIYIRNNRIDLGFRHIAGLLDEFDYNDLNKFLNLGYNFTDKDIMKLFSERSPEEYRKFMDSNKAQKLLSFDYSSEKYIINSHNEQFKLVKKLIPSITKYEFDKNYKLYNEVLSNYNVISDFSKLKKYSIQEIYTAYSRLNETAEVIFATTGKEASFNSSNIADLIEFSKKTNFFNFTSESLQTDVTSQLLKNSEIIKLPQYIKYVTKRNKVFAADNIQDIINYNDYCAKRILTDSGVMNYEQIKNTYINSLFTINTDAPGEEDNIIDELYYYRKYKKEGKITTSEDEKGIDYVIDNLISLMDCNPTADDFKQELYKRHKSFSNVNFDNVYRVIQSRMREFSKNDIVSKLNQTENTISNIPVEYIDIGNGEKIPIKRLDGQDFNLAICTVMPYCSGISRNKLKMDKNLIKNNMLYRELNSEGRCTGLVKQSMLGIAKSALQEEELRYAYLPVTPEQIEVSGKHDLSTRKRQVDNRVIRVASKTVQNRGFNDLVDCTLEEHNETAIGGVIPRYIVCVNRITPVAIKKYQMLKEEYEKNGIDQPIEILYIDAKNKYIPKIQTTWENHLSEITDELKKGTISPDIYQKYFNKRERNIALETLQMAYSTSYSDETWNPNDNKQAFNILSEILEKASLVSPKEYLGDLLNQVNLILNVSSPNYKYVYDHSIMGQVDTKKFESIRNILNQRIEQGKYELKNQEKPNYER